MISVYWKKGVPSEWVRRTTDTAGHGEELQEESAKDGDERAPVVEEHAGAVPRLPRSGNHRIAEGEQTRQAVGAMPVDFVSVYCDFAPGCGVCGGENGFSETKRAWIFTSRPLIL